MNFKSQYFETADDLMNAKNEAFQGVETRKERLRIIRCFTNMMNTLSEEEAEELGRTEITNHGLTYRAMLQNETQYTSMVTGTNGLVEIIVDTDNAEKDQKTGVQLSQIINRGAIHFKGKFADFWNKVSGEIVLAGGGPVTQNERYGWLPELRPNMFFPSETPLDAEQVTYCFDPKNLTMADLQKMQAAVKDRETSHINKDNLNALLDLLTEQIREKTTTFGSSSEETESSVRGNAETNKVTLPSWWYYEVKYRDNGEQYISATLFVDGSTAIKMKSEGKKQSTAQIIAYVDEAFEHAVDWLHFISVDSEIGSIKNVDTLRGVAELNYSSGTDMEELLNLIIEGEKIRARPKMRLTERANKNEVLAWDMTRDMFAPDGVEEMEMRSSSNGLTGPLSLLGQNAAGLSTSGISNGPGGGELRQQALQRQQNDAILGGNRVQQASNHLDSLLEMVVYRLLAGKTKPGAPGYNETMWIRAQLKRAGIDGAALAKRKHGRFEYIRVRAHRTIGNGDRQQQIETSDWLMSNVNNYQPIARPTVIHKATVLRTQDPDLADYLVKVPQAIVNAQKITAENEYDTIKRRAPLGQIIPIAADDIHQDHIPIHLLDMSGQVASHGLRPWDKLDVAVFVGAAQHVGEHIKTLLSNPDTNGEGTIFTQDYQKIVQAGQKIVQEVEEASGQQQESQSQTEILKLQLGWANTELRAREIGMKQAERENLHDDRASRRNLAERQQFTREINEDRRLQLDHERLRTDNELRQKQLEKQPTSSTSK